MSAFNDYQSLYYRRACIIWGSSAGGIMNLSPVDRSFGFSAFSKKNCLECWGGVFVQAYFNIFVVFILQV